MSGDTPLETPFTQHTGIRVPIICGPMYPCSNPELVAAASEAGGIGIVQPVSMTFVHGHDFREGIRLIKSLTDKPIGMNALIEKSSKKYHERMEEWVTIALDEGVRFFITSLGNPRWVVDRVKAYDGIVYHDVTERKWALKGLDGGVDGLIAVNNRAGGHAGALTQLQLLDELGDLNVPLICAGGIGAEQQFAEAIKQGYAGCQLGTRFIATEECSAAMPYKQAVVNAMESDVVLSNKITGVPVSIIKTPYIEKIGTKAGAFARWMLKGSKTKHWMRMFYTLRSAFQLRKSSLDEKGETEFWQAGKSVAGIHQIEPVDAIINRYETALKGLNR
ncbi:NAD(P)H-dependent flavin oxidoreductase [Candidatus Thiodiazotropha sp. CDECU1]|uniref:NAD(P)H-dependent flavin oxidoreductase n=1 Tax=Candidatus Thiodiazotropha sp. CDECU1 TaxID=3065865 RepID=UPI0029307434|nr:nitronate monooxygenase [Candidatus Thiodiazotropha sp. CDECU1]